MLGSQVRTLVTLFWMTLIYIGMLADKANITHIPLTGYLTTNPERMMFLKSAQNTAVYTLDNIAGPTKREFARAQILEERSRWCFINKCFNNIYFNSANTTEDQVNIANIISNIVPNRWVAEDH